MGGWSKIANGFCFLAAVALFVFGAELLMEMRVLQPVLEAADSVFPMSLRNLGCFISSASIALSAFLLVGNSTKTSLKLSLLAWFSGNLFFYQAVLLWNGEFDLLGCLGNLDGQIQIPPVILAPVLLAFFCLLFFADILLIVFRYFNCRKFRDQTFTVLDLTPHPKT
jgi:hypothetical protein